MSFLVDEDEKVGRLSVVVMVDVGGGAFSTFLAVVSCPWIVVIIHNLRIDMQ